MQRNRNLRAAAAGLLLACAATTGAAAETATAPTAATAASRAVLPLEAFGDLPSIEHMALSPNGRSLAVVGLLQKVRRLLILEEGKIRTQSMIGEAKVWSLDWASDDLVLLINSATVDLGPDFLAAKHEFYGAILVPADGSAQQMVFGKTPSMVHAVWSNYGIRQIDGRPVGFFGGVELQQSADRLTYMFDHGRPALFRVDLKRNSQRKVTRAASENHWRDWIVDGRGELAATLDVSAENGRWTIVNSRGDQIAAGLDPEGDVGLVSLGRDGSTLIYSVEDESKTAFRWFEVPLTGGEAKEVFADVEIAQTYVDPANGHMLGYLPKGEDDKPVLFAPAQEAVLRKVYRAFPDRKLRIEGWTPSFSHVLVSTSGNGDSGTWYVIDIAKLKADPVGYERPAIEAEQVGPISTFAYKAGDGLDLDGILTLPPGREAKNLPVVILPHGGPHARDEVEFDWWAQAFASRGYAVFQPNFRGSTNRDLAFQRAGYGQWGRKMQTDLSDGLAALAKQGIVDAKRACIAGASYGGYAALAGVTLQQGLYRCAVAVAPVSDLSAMYRTDLRESGGNRLLKRSLVESLGDPKTFAEVSPRRQAARADAPILLVHGRDDTVVPFDQSDAMARALRAAGKPYEMVVLREEDHWMSRAATRKQMLEAAVGFVRKNNPAE